MTRAHAITLFVILSTLTGLAELSKAEGWEVYYSGSGLFQAGRENQDAHTGQGCGVIRSVVAPKPREHALLLQKISARNFRGRRAELSGYLKTRRVEGWAGIWIRVDGRDGQVLGFQNMMDTPVRGDTEWTRYSLEVDVPAEAHEIHFGALLSGAGRVSADDFTLRAVGGTEPARALKQRIRTLPEEPRNLGFEK